MAETVCQIYRLANALRHGDQFIPTLPGVLAELMQVRIRPEAV
jgi:hypothetical protein